MSGLISRACQEVAARAWCLFKPVERISIRDFCDRDRYLSPETTQGGFKKKWQTSIVPYVAFIFLWWEDPRVRRVIVRSGVQISKTETMLCIMAYIAKFMGGPTQVIFPDKQQAQDEFVPKRFDPMIRDTPALHDIFFRKSREYINNKKSKTYVNGSFRFTGTAASDLASTPARYVLIDEISRCQHESGKEGNVLELAEARQSNFFDAKSFYTGTPIEKGTCTISALYDNSRKYRLVVPCPHCKELIHYEWDQMYRDSDDPLTFKEAYYVCQRCDEKIETKHRHKMLMAHEWECLNPEASYDNIGIHISGMYSPWTNWRKLMKQYLEALKAKEDGDESKLRTFWNTRLGLPFESETDGVDAEKIYNRREVYLKEVPAGVLYLTAGVDVNSNDLTVKVIGWGENRENWTVAYRQFFGDPSQKEVWNKLREFLISKFSHEWGFKIGISAVAVDQGYKTAEAESFVFRYRTENYFAVRGFQGSVDDPPIGEPSDRIKGAGKRRVPQWPVNGYQMTISIYSDLKQKEGKEGYSHFPDDSKSEKSTYSKKFFKELTCERIDKKFKNGYERKYFKKPDHVRNEPLDCRKYAYAARIILGLDAREVLKKKNYLIRKRDMIEEFANRHGLTIDEAYETMIENKVKTKSKKKSPTTERVPESGWMSGYKLG